MKTNAPLKQTRFLWVGPVITRNDRLQFEEMRRALRHFKLREAGLTAADWVRQEAWRFSPGRIFERRRERRAEVAFDQQYGTDTQVAAHPQPGDVASENFDANFLYLPSPVYAFRRFLANLNIKFEEFTFIDFGSGKGRTLLLASEQPFKRVIGVEYSQPFHARAQVNIEKYQRKRAGSVESVAGDAAAFDFPPDNLVIYCFNPFPEPVLTQVLANLARSVRARPRPILLVYLALDRLNLTAKEPDLAHGEHVLSSHGFELRNVFQEFRVYKFAGQ
ncbi:MAG: hypothetical protein NVSMB30_30900 [Hymenobacter sp.]